MRRTLTMLLLALMVVGTFALPASAKGKDEAPGRICIENDNTFVVDAGHPFEFVIQSTGGCVSSVAQGFDGTFENWSLSTAAYISQCKFLESMGIVEYPYDFYDNPDLHAKNRADCKDLLRSFHESLND